MIVFFVFVFQPYQIKKNTSSLIRIETSFFLVFFFVHSLSLPASVDKNTMLLNG